MGRRPAKAKAKTKRPVAGTTRKDKRSRVRQLEERLAEALKHEVDAVKREAEALAQQTATSEILRVISRSPTDVQPVFEAIARSATELCHGLFGGVFLREGDAVDLVAHHNFTPQGLAAFRELYPLPVDADSNTTRALRERRPIHVTDVQTDPGAPPRVRSIAHALGFRSLIMVPMLRESHALGVIGVSRSAVKPFSEREIVLLQTFADQAVIAIENVRLFKELEQKTRDLQAASQHKSGFLANISHELRTPLNAIIGFSEVLNERMFGELNERQAEYLKDIHASGQHLLSLINDILDLSKVEAGRMELEVTDFDLPAAIDNALILVRERAGRHSITLECDVEDRLGVMRGDERKVKQVLLNLLSNALKFTPGGGRVHVRAALNEGLVEVSVTDTGIGIAPEDQEAVFEEFRQVGTADKRVEGTGLGLALSRKLIELHGGRIWVKSRVGEGSTFTFTLPIPAVCRSC